MIPDTQTTRQLHKRCISARTKAENRRPRINTIQNGDGRSCWRPAETIFISQKPWKASNLAAADQQDSVTRNLLHETRRIFSGLEALKAPPTTAVGQKRKQQTWQKAEKLGINSSMTSGLVLACSFFLLLYLKKLLSCKHCRRFLVGKGKHQDSNVTATFHASQWKRSQHG